MIHFPPHCSSSSSSISSSSSSGKILAQLVDQPPAPAILNSAASVVTTLVNPLEQQQRNYHIDGAGPSSKRCKLTTDKTDRSHAIPAPSSSLPAPHSNLYTSSKIAILKYGLLKSGHHFRDEAIQQAFTPPCPQDLVNIIASYEAREYLNAFKLNHYGEASGYDSHTEKTFVELFYSSDTDSNLLQQEIIKHHSRVVLDSLFYRLSSVVAFQAAKEAHQRGDSQAQTNRERELHACINYLSFSKCEALIAKQLKQISDSQKKYNPINYRLENEAQIKIIRLNSDHIANFINAMHSVRCNPEKRGDRLEKSTIDHVMHRASTSILQKDFSAARSELSKAFDLACAARDKQHIVDISIKFIELEEINPVNSLAVTIQFFELIETLCLNYPQDLISYVRLLFAIEVLLRRQSQLPMLYQLFTKTYQPLFRALPPTYRAKHIYRYAMIYCEVNTNPYQRLDALVRSLQRIAEIDQKHNLDSTLEEIEKHMLDPLKPKARGISRAEVRKFEDVSCGEFLVYYASLSALIGATINKEFAHSEQSSVELSKLFFNLNNLNYDYQRYNPYMPTPALVLGRPEITQTSKGVSPQDLLMLAANCYKIALKILLQVDEDERAEPCVLGFSYLRSSKTLATPMSPFLSNFSRWEPFFATFDGLVHFYLEHQRVNELEVLLNRKTATHFKMIPQFDLVLKDWRKLLREKRKTTIPVQITIEIGPKKTKLNSFDCMRPAATPVQPFKFVRGWRMAAMNQAGY